jgi:hypothetical protein
MAIQQYGKCKNMSQSPMTYDKAPAKRFTATGKGDENAIHAKLPDHA